MKCLFLKPLFWFWLAGLAFCWHLSPWRTVFELPGVNLGYPYSVNVQAVGPNAFVLVTLGEEDAWVRTELIEYATGRRTVLFDPGTIGERVSPEGDWNPFGDYVFSPDGRYLAISLDHRAKKDFGFLFDLVTGESKSTALSRDMHNGGGFRFTSDSKRLVHWPLTEEGPETELEIINPGTAEVVDRIGWDSFGFTPARPDKDSRRSFHVRGTSFVVTDRGFIHIHELDRTRRPRHVSLLIPRADEVRLLDRDRIVAFNHSTPPYDNDTLVTAECRAIEGGKLLSVGECELRRECPAFSAEVCCIEARSPHWLFWRNDPTRQYDRAFVRPEEGSPYLLHEIQVEGPALPDSRQDDPASNPDGP